MVLAAVLPRTKPDAGVTVKEPHHAARRGLPWVLIGVLGGLVGWFSMYGVMSLLLWAGINPFLGPVFYLGWPVLVALGIGVIVTWASERFSAPARLDGSAVAKLASGALLATFVAYLVPIVFSA